jgi:hypothetical protein
MIGDKKSKGRCEYCGKEGRKNYESEEGNPGVTWGDNNGIEWN